MIYTVTFNPSLDYIVHTPQLISGTINRTSAEQILAGGKGINVSIVLKNLGLSTTALGFLGGFTGQEIKHQLDLQGVNNDFISLEQGLSRINVKVKGEQEETEINGSGPEISQKEISALFQQLDALQANDMLVLAGSIPSSLPADIYQQIMRGLAHKNIPIIVDATKSLLTNVLPYKPFLIKPNNHELSEIFNRPLHTAEALIGAAKDLQKQGAQHVLISRAGDGAILVSKDGQIFTAPAPQGTLINSVGAGDSMVAGFLAGYHQTKGNLQEALYWGIATGSASAFSEQLAKKKEVEALLASIR